MGEVLDFFSRTRKVTSTEASQPKPVANIDQEFLSIAQKNAQVQEKLRKERAQANQNVLKSYRIK